MSIYYFFKTYLSILVTSLFIKSYIIKICQRKWMNQSDKSETNKNINLEQNINTTPNKELIENKKQKRKKNAAFQSFLTKSQPPPMADISPKKALSGDNLQFQMIEQLKVCKICQKQYDQKSKLCEFCKDTLCGNHFRKKRINHQKNKYCRICDYCEDKYLMEKHYRNEMKTQESIVSQQLILFNKYKEQQQILQSKKVKYQLLVNKRTLMEQFIKKERNRFNVLQMEMQKKLFKLSANVQQNIKLQQKLNELQAGLPASFQEDFKVLQQQNRKITKQLVKYQKMCADAIKARCKKQKDMYEEYYQWQTTQKQQLKQQQKKQDCVIY